MTSIAQDKTPPWIIAHRGARDEAPENTVAAFERALTYPIDGIELDVQMSRDGHIIIYHDWTMQRLGGRKRYLFNLNREALAALDWGAWFHPGFAGEPLPVFGEVLGRLGPRTRWLIEIKSHPSERESGRITRLTEKVLALVDKHSHALGPDRVHILSFDPRVLQHAADLAPRWRYVLNLSPQVSGLVSDKNSKALKHLWAVDEQIGRLSGELIRQAHARGLKVFTYTCNTPGQVRKALDLGVDAILTDRPGWLTGRMLP